MLTIIILLVIAYIIFRSFINDIAFLVEKYLLDDDEEDEKEVK